MDVREFQEKLKKMQELAKSRADVSGQSRSEKNSQEVI